MRVLDQNSCYQIFEKKELGVPKPRKTYRRFLLLGTAAYAKRILKLYWQKKYNDFVHIQIKDDLAYIQAPQKNLSLYQMNKEIGGRIKILKTKLQQVGIF